MPNLRLLASVVLVTLGLIASLARYSHAQESSESKADEPARTEVVTVTCSSQVGERTHCPADVSGGVELVKTTGMAQCVSGETWGSDDKGVWTSEGCSAEFALDPSDAQDKGSVDDVPIYGTFSPGVGFLIGSTPYGSLSISAYALLRYMNQLPAEQSFEDHLGNTRSVDTRHDIYSHRILVFLKGWIGLQKLKYAIVFWTVNTTDQDAIFANIGYVFSDRISVFAGINGNPGSRSVQGSHPYWLGHDRAMADEYFRPFFTFGVWVKGHAFPGLGYTAMVGNNNSILGTTASNLTRNFSTGGSIWWMPTTKEFGPRGAYGDWESHEEVATRFGVSAVRSREDRYTDSVTGAPDNTGLRLGDSVNLFETGSLADGVTIRQADYRVLAVDAGMKYKGFFLQTEFYTRVLDNFVADGALPVSSVYDVGFYVQGAFFPIPKKLEVYAVTSQIFADEDAGFDTVYEYVGGTNFYPADTRDIRLNLQVVRVVRSPVSSSFGYYIGGQDGTTIAAAVSIFF